MNVEPHVTNFIGNAEIQTAYNEVGEGSSLLLVHGFTGSKLDFNNQLNWFSDLRRVIAYDQRGHGESSNQGPYSYEQLVSDLINLLDQLDIESCDLLGHSLGGMVAMRAVATHPDRFNSLILMDTAAAPVEIWPEEMRAQLANLVSEQGCEAMLELSRNLPVSESAARGVAYLGEAEHWRRIGVKLSQMDPDAFRDLADLLSDSPSVLAELSRITCPTSIVYGEHDAGFVEPSKAMAAAIPHARLVKIPAAGHSPQYENAEVWRAAVRNHLS